MEQTICIGCSTVFDKNVNQYEYCPKCESYALRSMYEYHKCVEVLDMHTAMHNIFVPFDNSEVDELWEGIDDISKCEDESLLMSLWENLPAHDVFEVNFRERSKDGDYIFRAYYNVVNVDIYDIYF